MGILTGQWEDSQSVWPIFAQVTLVTEGWKGVGKEEVAFELLLTAEYVPCICTSLRWRT